MVLPSTVCFLSTMHKYCGAVEDRPASPPVGLTRDLVVLGRGLEPPPGAALSLTGAPCPLQWLSTDDERISRLHASITAQWQQGHCHPLVSIEDHSRNGTFLNGTLLQPGRPIVLSHGDQISLVLSVNPLAEVSYMYEQAAPAALAAAAEQRRVQWNPSPSSGDMRGAPPEASNGRDGCRRSLIYEAYDVIPSLLEAAAVAQHGQPAFGGHDGATSGVPVRTEDFKEGGTTGGPSSPPPPPPRAEAPSSPDRRRLTKGGSIPDNTGGSSACGIRRRSRRAPPTEPLRDSTVGAGRPGAAGYISPDENGEVSDDPVESPTATPRSGRSPVHGCTISPVHAVDASTDAVPVSTRSAAPPRHHLNSSSTSSPSTRQSFAVESRGPLSSGTQVSSPQPSRTNDSSWTSGSGSPHNLRAHARQQPPASPARSPGPASGLVTASSVPLPQPPQSPRARPLRTSTGGQFSPGSTASGGTSRPRRPSRLLHVSTPESLPPGAVAHKAGSAGSQPLLPTTAPLPVSQDQHRHEIQLQQQQRTALHGEVDAPAGAAAKLAAALAEPRRNLHLRRISRTRHSGGSTGADGGESSDASQDEDVQEFSFSTVLRPQVQPAPTPPPSCAGDLACTTAPRSATVVIADAEACRTSTSGSRNSSRNNSSSGGGSGQPEKNSRSNVAARGRGSTGSSTGMLLLTRASSASPGCPTSSSSLLSSIHSPCNSSSGGAGSGGSRAPATAPAAQSSSSLPSWPGGPLPSDRGFSSGSGASPSPDCSPDSQNDRLVLHPDIVLRNRHPHRRHTRYGESMDTPSSYSPSSVSLRRQMLHDPSGAMDEEAGSGDCHGSAEPVYSNQVEQGQVYGGQQSHKDYRTSHVLSSCRHQNDQRVQGCADLAMAATPQAALLSDVAERKTAAANSAGSGAAADNAEYMCPYLPYTPITLLQHLDARLGDGQQELGTPQRPTSAGVQRGCDSSVKTGCGSVCGSSSTGERVNGGGERRHGRLANTPESCSNGNVVQSDSLSGCGRYRAGFSSADNAAAGSVTLTSGGDVSSGCSWAGTPPPPGGRNATAAVASASASRTLQGSSSVPRDLSCVWGSDASGACRFSRADSAGALGVGYGRAGRAVQYSGSTTPAPYNVQTVRHFVSRSDTRVLVCHSEGRLNSPGPGDMAQCSTSSPEDRGERRVGSRDYSDGLQPCTASGAVRGRGDDLGSQGEKVDAAPGLLPAGSDGFPRTLMLRPWPRTGGLRAEDTAEEKAAAEVPSTSRYAAGAASDELLCGLCGDYLRRAIAVTPCGHSFCGDCLSQHFAAAMAAGAKLGCPEGCANFVQLAINKPARRLEELMLGFSGMGLVSPRGAGCGDGDGGAAATTLSRPTPMAGCHGRSHPILAAATALSRAGDGGRAASDPGPSGVAPLAATSSTAAAPSRFAGGDTSTAVSSAAAGGSAAAAGPDSSPAYPPSCQPSPRPHQHSQDEAEDSGGSLPRPSPAREGSSLEVLAGGSDADTWQEAQRQAAAAGTVEAINLCPIPDEALPMSATRLHVRQAEHLLLRLREVLELRPEPSPTEAAGHCIALLSPLTRLAATYTEAREALSAMGALQGCLLVMEQQLRMELQREWQEIRLRLGASEPLEQQQSQLAADQLQHEQQQQQQDRARAGRSQSYVELEARCALDESLRQAADNSSGVRRPGASSPMQLGTGEEAPGVCGGADAARRSLEAQRCACGLMGALLRPFGMEDGCQQSNQWALARLGGVEVLLQLLRRAVTTSGGTTAWCVADAVADGNANSQTEPRSLRRLREEGEALAVSTLTVLRLLVAGNTMTQAHVAYEGATLVMATIHDMSYSEGVKTAGMQLLSEMLQGDDATHAAIRLQFVEGGVMRLAVAAFGGRGGGYGVQSRRSGPDAQPDLTGAGRSPLLAACITAMGSVFAASMPRALRVAAVAELRRLRVLPRLRNCLRSLELEAADRGSRRTARHAATSDADDALLASGRRLERRLDAVLSATTWWRAARDEMDDPAGGSGGVELSWRGLAAAASAGFAVGATLTAAVVAALV